MKRSKKITLIGVLFFVLILAYFAFNLSKKKEIENTKKTEITNNYYTYSDMVSGSSYYVTNDYIVIDDKNILSFEGTIIDKQIDNITLIKNYNSEEYTKYYYYKSGEFYYIKNSALEVLKTNDDNVLKNSEIKDIYMLNNELVIFYVTDLSKFNIVFYNIENKSFSDVISSSSDFVKMRGTDKNYVLISNNNLYTLYSLDEKKELSKKYSSIGVIDGSESINKSNKFLVSYKGKYGFISDIGESIIKTSYNDIVYYNNDYFVIKESDGYSLYNYENECLLPKYEFIFLNNDYIVTYASEIIDVYNKSLEILKSATFDLKLTSKVELSSTLTEEETNEEEIIHNNISIEATDKALIISVTDSNDVLLTSVIYKDGNLSSTTELIKGINYNDKVIGFYKVNYNAQTKIAKINIYDNNLNGKSLIEMAFDIEPKVSYYVNDSVVLLVGEEYIVYNEKIASKYKKCSGYKEAIAIANEVFDYDTNNMKLYDKNNNVLSNAINTYYKLNNDKYLFNVNNSYQVFTKK